MYLPYCCVCKKKAKLRKSDSDVKCCVTAKQVLNSVQAKECGRLHTLLSIVNLVWARGRLSHSWHVFITLPHVKCSDLRFTFSMSNKQMDQIMNWWYLVTKSSGPSQTLSSVTWVCMSNTGLPSCPRAKGSAAPAYVEIKSLLCWTVHTLYCTSYWSHNKTGACQTSICMALLDLSRDAFHVVRLKACQWQSQAGAK